MIFGDFAEKGETVWRATKHCVGGKRRLRCLELMPAPQGPNRGESLRGGISRYALAWLGGLGRFPFMLAHFSVLWLIFSNF